MATRRPLRLTLALALTLGSGAATIAVAAPAQASTEQCGPINQGHLLSQPGGSILAWRYCGTDNLPVTIQRHTSTGWVVLESGRGSVLYPCNGTAVNEYESAGGEFSAACG